MNENFREKALGSFEEYIHQYCRHQFHNSKIGLEDFVHYTFSKFGRYLLDNNSLYLNWEYSFASFEILNEIVKGECIQNSISEIEWMQIFAALFACHSARTLGSNPNDLFESAAIPHSNHSVEYLKINSDNELWQYMAPRALLLTEEMSKEFPLLNSNLVKELLLKADPFQIIQTPGRSFNILRSSLLIPMISDPRLKHKFLLLYKDLEKGEILKRLKISEPDHLKRYITEELWNTAYLQIFHRLEVLEKTSSGKIFLSYLYYNVASSRDNKDSIFE